MRQPKLFSDPVAVFPLKAVEGGVRLFIKATPKSSKNRLGEIIKGGQDACFLKVYVTASPENNQANQAIIDLISKSFKIPKSSIEVISGLAYREKTLLIQGKSFEELRAELDSL